MRFLERVALQQTRLKKRCLARIRIPHKKLRRIRSSIPKKLIPKAPL